MNEADEARLMLEALHSTLRVLNPLGTEILVGMMERMCGVFCSEKCYSSKEDIEAALFCVLGVDAGEMIVREWNKAIIQVAK